MINYSCETRKNKIIIILPKLLFELIMLTSSFNSNDIYWWCPSKSGLEWVVHFKVQIGDGPTSGSALFCIIYIMSHIKERKGKNFIEKKKFNRKAFFFHDQLQSPWSSLNPNFHSSGPVEWNKSSKFSSNACKPIIWIKHQSSGST